MRRLPIFILKFLSFNIYLKAIIHEFTIKEIVNEKDLANSIDHVVDFQAKKSEGVEGMSTTMLSKIVANFFDLLLLLRIT